MTRDASLENGSSWQRGAASNIRNTGGQNSGSQRSIIKNKPLLLSHDMRIIEKHIGSLPIIVVQCLFSNYIFWRD
jgi:hypothetical protein